jgi:hypothetical protein
MAMLVFPKTGNSGLSSKPCFFLFKIPSILSDLHHSQLFHRLYGLKTTFFSYGKSDQTHPFHHPKKLQSRLPGPLDPAGAAIHFCHSYRLGK